MGAVDAGVEPGVLVKIIGASTCDCMVAPLSARPPDIPGLCGVVPDSILLGMYGLEAGQSAVGDIFNWFVPQQVMATLLRRRNILAPKIYSSPLGCSARRMTWFSRFFDSAYRERQTKPEKESHDRF